MGRRFSKTVGGQGTRVVGVLIGWVKYVIIGELKLVPLAEPVLGGTPGVIGR